MFLFSPKPPLKKYGWKPDLPDHNDFPMSKLLGATAPVKPEPIIDLSSQGPSVIYNQGELGSCTANAIARAIQHAQNRQKKRDKFMPARLFIYYNERAMEGTVNSDSGACIRDGIKSINKLGVCPEDIWPYIINKFTTKPSKKCYTTALLNQSVSYHRVEQTEQGIKQALSHGFPVIMGFTCYESFESDEVARTGILPMPKKGERSIGGHAVLIEGNNDSKRQYKVPNSYGEEWGDHGYLYAPYDYFLNPDLACDFWAIDLME